jgi:hypothetical protein
VRRLQKKQQNGDRQGMLKPIQHALTIANFTIDRPAPLEINRKIATMGGGDSHRVKKLPLFVRRLSVFWVFFCALKK